MTRSRVLMWAVLGSLAVGVCVGLPALAQPAEPGPADAAPPGDPPPAPDSDGADDVLPPETPPEAPPGGTGEGTGPGLPGGGTSTPEFDPNAPDTNTGFSTDAFPEDIRSQLEAILPDPGAQPSSDGLLSMAFAKTEIEDFLQFLATESGYTILPPADLSGQITIVSRVDVTLDDAFAILEAWLRIRNFTMTRDTTRKIISIRPLSKAKSIPGPVHGEEVPLDLADPNEIVTHIERLRYIEATKVVELLTPLVDSEWASVTASESLNCILVTDVAANVERLLGIMRSLDVETAAVSHKVIPLQYASATAPAELLDQLFGESSGLPEELLQRMGIDPSSLAQGPAGYIGETLQVKILADERTNSLIVMASEARLELIERIAKDLDVDTSAKVEYKVIPLKQADAGEVAESLNQIFEQPQGGPESSGGGNRMRMMWNPWGQTSEEDSYSGLKENVVVADVRTNSIIVTATKENMAVFEQMVESLDTAQSLNEICRVFELKNATATDLAEVLTSAFSGSQSRSNRGGGFLSFIFGGSSGASASGPLELLREITVTAEEKSNSLIITGPPQAFELVKQIVDDLDQPQKQVYIRVIIADVTLTDELRYGVEWDWFSRSDPSFSGDSTLGLDSWDEGIRWGVISDSIQGFLEALDAQTNIKVISTPSILTLDNVEGTISSGREVTIRTGQTETSGGSVRDTTDRIDAAITLTVTPHISADSLRLEIEQTIDDLGNADSYGNPEIIKRSANAEVLVRTGETIVLGGVIQESITSTKREIPILKEIPIIGNLFESTEEEVRRSELMVFITPYVLDDAADGPGSMTRTQMRLNELQRMDTDISDRFPEIYRDEEGKMLPAFDPEVRAAEQAARAAEEEERPSRSEEEDASPLPITRRGLR